MSVLFLASISGFYTYHIAKHINNMDVRDDETIPDDDCESIVRIFPNKDDPQTYRIQTITNKTVNSLTNLWENKDKYNNKSREEYFKLISWNKWKEKWKNITTQFNNLQIDCN